MSSMAPITRLCVGHRLSEASVFNGIVHLGGMVPESGATDIKGQTADVLAQVDAHLAACGSDKSRILRVQIYLANIADIAAMNSGVASFSCRATSISCVSASSSSCV